MRGTIWEHLGRGAIDWSYCFRADQDTISRAAAQSAVPFLFKPAVDPTHTHLSAFIRSRGELMVSMVDDGVASLWLGCEREGELVRHPNQWLVCGGNLFAASRALYVYRNTCPADSQNKVQTTMRDTYEGGSESANGISLAEHSK